MNLSESQDILFYSNTPLYREFSNMFERKLTIDGETWPSVENYYQAMKYVDHPGYMKEIQNASSPFQAKKLGGSRKYSIRKSWDDDRIIVMRKALKAKFDPVSHPDLHKVLLSTGSRNLVENSPDAFWGRGSNGRGRNMLGYMLMKIRKDFLDAIAKE